MAEDTKQTKFDEIIDIEYITKSGPVEYIKNGERRRNINLKPNSTVYCGTCNKPMKILDASVSSSDVYNPQTQKKESFSEYIATCKRHSCELNCSAKLLIRRRLVGKYDEPGEIKSLQLIPQRGESVDID